MFVHEGLLLLGMDVEEGKKDISDIDRDISHCHTFAPSLESGLFPYLSLIRACMGQFHTTKGLGGFLI